MLHCGSILRSPPDRDFTCVDFCGNQIVVGSSLGTIFIVELHADGSTENPRQIRPPAENKGLQSPVTSIQTSPCLRYVAAGTAAGSVVVLSVVRNQIELLYNHEEHAGSPVLSLAWRADSQRLYSGASNGQVIELDTSSSSTPAAVSFLSKVFSKDTRSLCKCARPIHQLACSVVDNTSVIIDLLIVSSGSHSFLFQMNRANPGKKAVMREISKVKLDGGGFKDQTSEFTQPLNIVTGSCFSCTIFTDPRGRKKKLAHSILLSRASTDDAMRVSINHVNGEELYVFDVLNVDGATDVIPYPTSFRILKELDHNSYKSLVLGISAQNDLFSVNLQNSTLERVKMFRSNVCDCATSRCRFLVLSKDLSSSGTVIDLFYIFTSVSINRPMKVFSDKLHYAMAKLQRTIRYKLQKKEIKSAKGTAVIIRREVDSIGQGEERLTKDQATLDGDAKSKEHRDAITCSQDGQDNVGTIKEIPTSLEDPFTTAAAFIQNIATPQGSPKTSGDIGNYSHDGGVGNAEGTHSETKLSAFAIAAAELEEDSENLEHVFPATLHRNSIQGDLKDLEFNDVNMGMYEQMRGAEDSVDDHTAGASEMKPSPPPTDSNEMATIAEFVDEVHVQGEAENTAFQQVMDQVVEPTPPSWSSSTSLLEQQWLQVWMNCNPTFDDVKDKDLLNSAAKMTLRNMRRTLTRQSDTAHSIGERDELHGQHALDSLAVTSLKERLIVSRLEQSVSSPSKENRGSKDSYDEKSPRCSSSISRESSAKRHSSNSTSDGGGSLAEDISCGAKKTWDVSTVTGHKALGEYKLMGINDIKDKLMGRAGHDYSKDPEYTGTEGGDNDGCTKKLPPSNCFDVDLECSHGFGLGLIQERNGLLTVNAFNTLPNGDMMPAQACGFIELGDILTQIDDVDLLEIIQECSERVIEVLKEVEQECRKKGRATLRFQYGDEVDRYTGSDYKYIEDDDNGYNVNSNDDGDRINMSLDGGDTYRLSIEGSAVVLNVQDQEEKDESFHVKPTYRLPSTQATSRAPTHFSNYQELNLYGNFSHDLLFFLRPHECPSSTRRVEHGKIAEMFRTQLYLYNKSAISKFYCCSKFSSRLVNPRSKLDSGLYSRSLWSHHSKKIQSGFRSLIRSFPSSRKSIPSGSIKKIDNHTFNDSSCSNDDQADHVVGVDGVDRAHSIYDPRSADVDEQRESTSASNGRHSPSSSSTQVVRAQSISAPSPKPSLTAPVISQVSTSLKTTATTPLSEPTSNSPSRSIPKKGNFDDEQNEAATTAVIATANVDSMFTYNPEWRSLVPVLSEMCISVDAMFLYDYEFLDYESSLPLTRKQRQERDKQKQQYQSLGYDTHIPVLFDPEVALQLEEESMQIRSLDELYTIEKPLHIEKYSDNEESYTDNDDDDDGDDDDDESDGGENVVRMQKMKWVPTLGLQMVEANSGLFEMHEKGAIPELSDLLDTYASHVEEQKGRMRLSRQKSTSFNRSPDNGNAVKDFLAKAYFGDDDEGGRESMSRPLTVEASAEIKPAFIEPIPLEEPTMLCCGLIRAACNVTFDSKQILRILKCWVELFTPSSVLISEEQKMRNQPLWQATKDLCTLYLLMNINGNRILPITMLPSRLLEDWPNVAELKSISMGVDFNVFPLMSNEARVGNQNHDNFVRNEMTSFIVSYGRYLNLDTCLAFCCAHGEARIEHRPILWDAMRSLISYAHEDEAFTAMSSSIDNLMKNRLSPLSMLSALQFFEYLHDCVDASTGKNKKPSLNVTRNRSNGSDSNRPQNVHDKSRVIICMTMKHIQQILDKEARLGLEILAMLHQVGIVGWVIRGIHMIGSPTAGVEYSLDSMGSASGGQYYYYQSWQVPIRGHNIRDPNCETLYSRYIVYLKSLLTLNFNRSVDYKNEIEPPRNDYYDVRYNLQLDEMWQEYFYLLLLSATSNRRHNLLESHALTSVDDALKMHSEEQGSPWYARIQMSLMMCLRAGYYKGVVFLVTNAISRLAASTASDQTHCTQIEEVLQNALLTSLYRNISFLLIREINDTDKGADELTDAQQRNQSHTAVFIRCLYFLYVARPSVSNGKGYYFHELKRIYELLEIEFDDKLLSSVNQKDGHRVHSDSCEQMMYKKAIVDACVYTGNLLTDMISRVIAGRDAASTAYVGSIANITALSDQHKMTTLVDACVCALGVENAIKISRASPYLSHALNLRAYILRAVEK